MIGRGVEPTRGCRLRLPDGKAERPITHLAGFKGILQVDSRELSRTETTPSLIVGHRNEPCSSRVQFRYSSLLHHPFVGRIKIGPKSTSLFIYTLSGDKEDTFRW